MKHFLIAIACLSAVSAYGQTKEEMITELITLTRPDSVISATLAPSVAGAVNFVQQQQNDTAHRPELQTYAKMELGNVVHRFTQKEVATAYDARYSEEEVAGLVAFFKSSAGRKWLKTSDDMQKSFLQDAYMDVTLELRELLTVKVQALMAAEMKKAVEEKAASEKEEGEK